MKYNINKELLKIAKQKAPSNIKLYPLISFAMKYMFKCKSDDAVNVIQYEIAGYMDAKLKTYVIEPRGCTEDLPCVVFYHGGGFLLRASGAHYQIAKWYAERTKCKVVYVDYRLAPKYSFPIPVEDCYCAYLNNVSVVDVKYASPIEAERLSFFPRTYMEVAEFDCLHDEGIDFSDRLRQEGVVVELYEEKGTCHGFETALKSTILINAMERRINWLKEILCK